MRKVGDECIGEKEEKRKRNIFSKCWNNEGLKARRSIYSIKGAKAKVRSCPWLNVGNNQRSRHGRLCRRMV